MKKLYIVRHAKSDWDSPLTPDFDRSLNERGFKNALQIGEFLRKSSISAQLIISSPALRAITTAQLIAKEINYSPEKILQEPNFYNFNTDGDNVLETLAKLPNHTQSVMVFGHNDTFSMLANRLTHQKVKHMPTCSVVAITFNTNTWESIFEANSILDFFITPKQLN